MHENSPPCRVIPKLLDGFWKQNKDAVYLFKIAFMDLTPLSEEVSILSAYQPDTETQHCQIFNAIFRNHF